MNSIRRRSIIAASIGAIVIVLAAASPAAAATLDQKLGVMLSWTQPAATSYGAWNNARLD